VTYFLGTRDREMVLSQESRSQLLQQGYQCFPQKIFRQIDYEHDFMIVMED
jgi:hypothetical protein